MPLPNTDYSVQRRMQRPRWTETRTLLLYPSTTRFIGYPTGNLAYTPIILSC